GRCEMSPSMSRRHFLAGSGGLVLAFTLERTGAAFGAGAGKGAAAPPAALNGFLRIGEDDSNTVILPKAERGQGVAHAFRIILADELGADMKAVYTEFAPVDEQQYGRQLTGGSKSIRTRYKSLRDAGAAAREMLVAAAAAEWKVGAESCQAAGGRVAGP